MDVGKLEVTSRANAGFDLVLVHPRTGELTDVVIKVLGRDSAVYRQLSAEQQRQRVTRVTKAGRMNLGAVTDSDVEKDNVALLAACTKAWGTTKETLEEGEARDKLTYHGEQLECTRENAIRVYTEEPWIRDQVELAVVDRANFSKG